MWTSLPAIIKWNQLQFSSALSQLPSPCLLSERKSTLLQLSPTQLIVWRRNAPTNTKSVLMTPSVSQPSKTARRSAEPSRAAGSSALRAKETATLPTWPSAQQQTIAFDLLMHQQILMNEFPPWGWSLMAQISIVSVLVLSMQVGVRVRYMMMCVM